MVASSRARLAWFGRRQTRPARNEIELGRDCTFMHASQQTTAAGCTKELGHNFNPGMHSIWLAYHTCLVFSPSFYNNCTHHHDDSSMMMFRLSTPITLFTIQKYDTLPHDQYLQSFCTKVQCLLYSICKFQKICTSVHFVLYCPV